MASKWTYEKDNNATWDRWFVKCSGEYVGSILRHEYIALMFRYSIPDQTYAPRAYPSVARAMKAMRATLRWRKKQRQQKPLDTQEGGA